MSAKSDAFETALIAHIFTNADVAAVGDATGLRGSSAAGSLYVALHTADPGEAGNQSTSECAYTGYARVAVARGSAWTVNGSSVSPAAAIDFAKNTGSLETAAWWSVGVASSGSGMILYRAPLQASAAAPVPFTATAADVITAPGISFSVGDRAVVSPLEGQSLPSGLSAGTVYWVKTVSGNDVTLSTSSGGATVDITAAGAGLIQKAYPLDIRTNDAPRIETTATITEG